MLNKTWLNKIIWKDVMADTSKVGLRKNIQGYDTIKKQQAEVTNFGNFPNNSH